MAVTPPAHGAAPDRDATLACGRDAATAWELAAAGVAPDQHERGCPHCTTARADAVGLESMVARMAAQRFEPPPLVMDRVMEAVRGELRPNELLVLESPLGPARLSRTAAATVLRGVVDRMSGLRARSCHIVQRGAPDGIDGTGTAIDVAITVSARFGVDLASVTARVRQMVTTAGEQALGLPVHRVDIEVVDVFEELP